MIIQVDLLFSCNGFYWSGYIIGLNDDKADKSSSDSFRHLKVEIWIDVDNLTLEGIDNV